MSKKEKSSHHKSEEKKRQTEHELPGPGLVTNNSNGVI